jgi:hypothetical protein
MASTCENEVYVQKALSSLAFLTETASESEGEVT